MNQSCLEIIERAIDNSTQLKAHLERARELCKQILANSDVARVLLDAELSNHYWKARDLLKRTEELLVRFNLSKKT